MITLAVSGIEILLFLILLVLLFGARNVLDILVSLFILAVGLIAIAIVLLIVYLTWPISGYLVAIGASIALIKYIAGMSQAQWQQLIREFTPLAVVAVTLALIVAIGSIYSMLRDEYSEVMNDRDPQFICTTFYNKMRKDGKRACNDLKQAGRIINEPDPIVHW